MRVPNSAPVSIMTLLVIGAIVRFSSVGPAATQPVPPDPSLTAESRASLEQVYDSLPGVGRGPEISRIYRHHKQADVLEVRYSPPASPGFPWGNYIDRLEVDGWVLTVFPKDIAYLEFEKDGWQLVIDHDKEGLKLVLVRPIVAPADTRTSGGGWTGGVLPVKAAVLALALFGMGVGCNSGRESLQDTYSYTGPQLEQGFAAAQQLGKGQGSAYDATRQLFAFSEGFCAASGSQCSALTIRGDLEDRPTGKVLTNIVLLTFDELGQQTQTTDRRVKDLQVPLKELDTVNQIVRGAARTEN